MNENGLQETKTFEKQQEELKQEQNEAEKTYRGGMQLGTLNHDPTSVQELAQTILEGKMQIEDLEASRAMTDQEKMKYIESKMQ